MFSGDVVRFGPFEFVSTLFHRYMIIHYILLYFFVITFDTRSDHAKLFVDERARNIALSIVCGVLMLMLVLVALVVEYISYRWGTVRIKASPYLLAAVTIGIGVDILISNESLMPTAKLLVLVVYYFVLIEAFAHMLMLVVVPRVLGDLRGRRPGALPKTVVPVAEPQRVWEADHVEIGGKRIKPDTLIRIMAEGNYIRIITKDERIYLPGPFGAVVDPLPEWLGVRASRSDWVAARAAQAIRRDGRDMFVDMEDGTSVRVANSRQKVVLSVLKLPVDRVRLDAVDQGPGVAANTDRSIQTG